MWYVVQVTNGQEAKVCELVNRTVARMQPEAANQLLHECFVPSYQAERKVHGQWQTVSRNLFPGYVIAVTDHVEDLNRALRSVRTFTRILGNEQAFIPLDRTEMAFIESFTSKKSRTIPMSKAVAEGDSIRVIEGPLHGHEGWISQVNRRKGTALVEMSMFGRTISVEIGLAVVSAE